ncbi:tripartite motif-containing protein 2-like [Saccostrea cucullata]|uniref:tripartite motif-containing protein 2-like n=1 Tax=Saccostrea cuccullata TaxID=36930 RepID=UPI002ED40272
MTQRVVQNIENDYLICSICLGRYTDPRLLPCGHSFCRQCLSDYIQQTVVSPNARTLKCPIDRGFVSGPGSNIHTREWASSFPVDQFALNLLSIVNEQERGGPRVAINSQPINRGPGPPSSGTSHNFQTCAVHNGRLMEYFCIGCNELVCAQCAIDNHRTRRCDCLSFEEAVTKLQPKANSLHVRFQNLIFRAQQLAQYGSPEHNSLQQAKSRAMESLTEIESNINRFSQLCFQNAEDLRQEIAFAGQELPSESRQLAVLYDKIQDTKLTFDNILNTNSTLDILNTYRRIESQASEYDRSLASTTQRNPRYIEMSDHATFSRFLNNPPPLASLKVKYPNRRDHQQHINSINEDVEHNAAVSPLTLPVQNPNSGNRRMLTSTVRGHRTQNRQDQTRSKSKSVINVKNPQEDTTTWHLNGIVFIGYHVLVIDSYNNTLRKCSIAGTFTTHETLPIEGPASITLMDNPTEVAISQPEKKQIVIISTDQELAVKETIRTNKPYDVICLHQRTNFVTCSFRGAKCIDIINRVGRVQISIERSRILRDPRYLTVTRDGLIVVSDNELRRVICMNSEGQVQWTHTPNAAPWGVASDKMGKIYVCLDNNDVQTLSDEGHVLEKKFLSARDGIKMPYAICVRSRQLAITEFGSSLFTPNSPWVHIISV